MNLELAISVLAVGISLITLVGGVWIVAHYEKPDVAEVKQRLLALDQEVTDINDRVGQWMRRESVRRMRAGKQDDLPANGEPRIVDRKAELRKRAMAARQQ